MDHELPVSRWYEAINVRRSRRRFTGEPLPAGMAAHLDHWCDRLSSSSLRLVPIDRPDQLFRGLIGPVGRIQHAPLCVALVGEARDPSLQEQAGYLGQGLVLEATAAGLATCWVGLFREGAVADRVRLQSSERVPAVIAVGLVAGSYAVNERIVSGALRSHRRKPLVAMCRGLEPERWPAWVRTALAAARLAPSALNRQPWRFEVAPESITVATAGGPGVSWVSPRLDCGIAMLHLELGAVHAGIRVSWEQLTAPRVARLRVER